MAELKQGILGGISGKVGTVVGASWRGKNIIRAIPRKTSKKATLPQLEQRNKFKLVSSFLQPLNRLLGRYFGTSKGLKSKTNLALAYHLQEAVRVEGVETIMQEEKIVLSKGVLPSLSGQTTAIENGTLTLTWTLDEGNSLAKPSDLITVVVYEKQSRLFQIFEKVATRESMSFSTALFAANEDAVFCVWFFLTNAVDTECSTSVFWSREQTNE